MGQRRRGRFDKNRDRCVNGSELYQICRAVECAVTAMEVQEMLRMFDNDGDGTVRRQRQLSGPTACGERAMARVTARAQQCTSVPAALGFARGTASTEG
jgi:hypothetical protein